MATIRIKSSKHHGPNKLNAEEIKSADRVFGLEKLEVRDTGHVLMIIK